MNNYSLRKRFLGTLILNFCLVITSFAQSSDPKSVSIKGKVVDTTNITLPMATVLLLNPADNKLLYFTHTDSTGFFSFNNIKINTYLLKVSYLSYFPFLKTLNPDILQKHDLGDIMLKPIAQILTEVVIKAAQAPIIFHGDTIEYNAASFKVPPGSTVEDLLRRLPGIDVDNVGKLSTQGKVIKTVYVNGNRFFGDNPLIATKNLGVDAVSKVQVYDEKSETEKMTGIKDANKEKVMNLALKKEYSNSSFGKMMVGTGTNNRWLTNGNYNRFNDKWQLSFIGFGNNVNQTGVNWSDYNDFKSKGDFRYKDNGDFGFDIRGLSMIVITNPFNLPDNKGFVKNWGGGTNYNWLGKKTKFYSSYVFNQIDQNLNQFINRTTFLKDNNSYNNADTAFRNNLIKSHSLDLRIQSDLDTNNNLIAKASVNYAIIENQNNLGQLYTSSLNIPMYKVNYKQFTNTDSWNISSVFLYSHRFNKEGRSFSYSAGFNSVKTDINEAVQNMNQFYDATTLTDQISRLNTTCGITSEMKSSLLYTQPLLKNLYLESFYNFNYRKSTSDNQIDNALLNNKIIDSLSSRFQSNTLFNRLGLMIHLSNGKIDIRFGLAGQSLYLSGKQTLYDNVAKLSNLIQKSYLDLVPNFSTRVYINKQNNIYLYYTSGISAPRINDLSPVPLTNNPLFVFYGNPYLKPGKVSSLITSYNVIYPKSFSQLSLSSTITFYQNQIVYNQTISTYSNGGYQTITRPMNVSGANQIEGSIYYNISLFKSKFRISLSTGGMQERSVSYINEILNTTLNSSLNGSLSFTYSPSAKLYIYLTDKISYNYITYSINKEQNQYLTSQNVVLSTNYQIAKKIFFENILRYDIYRNAHYKINRELPVWNASVRKIAGKAKRIEIRFSAYDILDKTLNLSQIGRLNYFETQYTPTLSRYFMLSLSYNLKGYEINSK